MGVELAVWINGVTGRMGCLVHKALDHAPGYFFAGGSDHHIYDRNNEKQAEVSEHGLAESLRNSDIVIDFSSVESNLLLFKALQHVPREVKPAVLIATTGLPEKQLAAWQAIDDTQVLIAPNTSLGIMVLAQLVRQLSKFLPHKSFDLEIVETHHRHKVDAPSGTAKFLAETAIAANKQLTSSVQRSGKRREMDVGVHAIRGGNVFGEHEIRFLGEQEEIYLGHRAFSRNLFAYGALTLSQWLVGRPPGAYDLFDVDLTD